MDYESFSRIEKEYIEYLLSGVKLTEVEIAAKFGDEAEGLANNFNLRKYVADIKIKRKRRASIVDDYNLDKAVEHFDEALAENIRIMKTGESERNRLAAAQFILKPVMSYLEKMGASKAQIESIVEMTDEEREIVIKLDAQDMKL